MNLSQIIKIAMTNLMEKRQMQTASDAMMLHIARITLAELKGGKDD
jgi:hypothetical protein